jgi:hypothetical protein
MSARTFVYRRLTTFLPLVALIGGPANPRVWAKKGMTSSIEQCPYIVYKMANSSDMELAEDTPVDRVYFQVWVHDFSDAETADYMRIDEVVKQVRAAFHLLGSAEESIWQTRWLETSQDLNDDTLNTVFRYVRFEMIKRETTS